MDSFTILHGDCLEQLRTLPADSVQCCVTSPPYWGLRDYGVDGQIGLEPTLQEWVDKMVAVFREVRRVLRPDGLCWLNLGDAYAGSRGAQSREHAGKHAPNVSALSANQVKAAGIRESGTDSLSRTPGLKPKDLIGQPWRVAFALQADGWWLRDAVVWHKPNPMPESVTDRCTKAYEMVFMLAKSERYYFDQDTISEPESENTNPRRAQAAYEQGAVEGLGHRQGPPGNPAPFKMPDGWATHRGGHGAFHKEGREKGAPAGRDIGVGHNAKPRKAAPNGSGTKNNPSFDEAMAVMPDRRNRRNVWTIASEPYPEAHFATFPTELPRICILASTKPGDTVIDPFNGSGTTGQVALELGRQYIGIELNAKYLELSYKRLSCTTIGLPLMERSP